MGILRLLTIVLAIALFLGILSCNNTSTNVSISPSLLFSLFPHELGEAPMVPHPRQSFDECNLCHINDLITGSSIKISDAHACDECHDANSDYDGPCQELEPVNDTCIYEVCHQYP